MSLARLALRVCAVIALRGATVAESRVRDSALSPLDALLDRDQAPVLTVSTEGTERKGADLRPQVTLAIEVALKVRQPDADGSGAPVLGYAETDAELDMMLDLFEREVIDALADPAGSEAADLLRAIALIGGAPNSPGDEYSSIRGIGEAGERLAARQILITADVVLDPVPGDPVPDWLSRFLALIETDPEYASYHGLLTGFLARNAGRSSDFAEQARLFLDRKSADALAITALAHGADGQPVTLEELVVGAIAVPQDTRE